jgi:glucosyl-3-phosphoglycerate synthase
MDAVIPALNEEDTVGHVVDVLRRAQAIGRVIVVDNGSTDRTGDAAREAGADVISYPERGLGRAVKAGIRETNTDVILKTDADIDNWSRDWIDLISPVSPDCMTRVVFDSPYDSFPVTRLVVEPLLRKLWPELPMIPLPITGTYAFRPALFDLDQLSDNWAWDISLLCATVEARIDLVTVDVGVLIDRRRDMTHNVHIATEILHFFLERYGKELTE